MGDCYVFAAGADYLYTRRQQGQREEEEMVSGLPFCSLIIIVKTNENCQLGNLQRIFRIMPAN